jgi:hypothetical protein
MVRKLAGVVAAMLLVVAVAAFYAAAAESTAGEAKDVKATAKADVAAEKTAEKAPAAPEARAERPSDAGQPAERPSTPEESMARMEERMKSGGASEGTLMRYRQIQMAHFTLDEPIGLLALKEQLKLTPEQVKKLEDISVNARKEAKAALTKEQADTLEKMKDTPDSGAAMSAEMRSRMGSRRGGPGGGGPRGGGGGGE